MRGSQKSGDSEHEQAVRTGDSHALGGREAPDLQSPCSNECSRKRYYLRCRRTATEGGEFPQYQVGSLYSRCPFT